MFTRAYLDPGQQRVKREEEKSHHRGWYDRGGGEDGRVGGGF